MRYCGCVVIACSRAMNSTRFESRSSWKFHRNYIRKLLAHTSFTFDQFIHSERLLSKLHLLWTVNYDDSIILWSNKPSSKKKPAEIITMSPFSAQDSSSELTNTHKIISIFHRGWIFETITQQRLVLQNKMSVITSLAMNCS